MPFQFSIKKIFGYVLFQQYTHTHAKNLSMRKQKYGNNIFYYKELVYSSRIETRNNSGSMIICLQIFYFRLFGAKIWKINEKFLLQLSKFLEQINFYLDNFLKPGVYEWIFSNLSNWFWQLFSPFVISLALNKPTRLSIQKNILKEILNNNYNNYNGILTIIDREVIFIWSNTRAVVGHSFTLC